MVHSAGHTNAASPLARSVGRVATTRWIADNPRLAALVGEAGLKPQRGLNERDLFHVCRHMSASWLILAGLFLVGLSRDPYSSRKPPGQLKEAW